MSLSAIQRLCKQPSENRKFSMDFTSILGTGELISAINAVYSEKEGGYASDLVIGSTGLTSDSKTVEMFISSGTLGSTYRVEVLIDTDASQTIEGDGYLHVSDQ